MALVASVLITFFAAVLIVLVLSSGNPGPGFSPSNVPFTPHLVPTGSQSTCPGSAHSDPHSRLAEAEVRYRGEILGPESLAFDSAGCGPYASLSDGRIVRRRCATKTQLGDADKKEEEAGDDVRNTTSTSTSTSTSSWETFAVTSSEPNARCGIAVEFEDVCGRPLGIRFDKRTGELYIADAYKGLLKVGPQGGVAQTLLTQVEGQPLIFTNDLDIDSNGVVYFTDSSTKYRRRQFMLELIEAGPYGRLIKYDPRSGDAQVLMRGLRFANGVTLSKDESYLLVCETTLSRVHRFWLKGPNVGISEVFADLPGFPDNVRRGRIAGSSGGESSLRTNGDCPVTAAQGTDFFWVAIHSRRLPVVSWLQRHPVVRKLLYCLNLLRLRPFQKTGLILGLDGDGKVVEVLEDVDTTRVTAISEVEERVFEKHGDDNSMQRRQLWLGSVLNDYIAVYELQ